MVFSLAFAIAAVAAAQYVMWILNGQPVKRLERANRTHRLSSNGADLLPNLPSFIRRVCSGYALVWGVLRTQSV